jgi:hypothetical protein
MGELFSPRFPPVSEEVDNMQFQMKDDSAHG